MFVVVVSSFSFFFFFLRFLIIDPRKLGGHLFGIFLRIVSFSPAVSFLLLFKRSRVSTCSLDMNGLVESIENILDMPSSSFLSKR